jgi:BirA family biotin operon repressor/biotin-[acetyl-CoA-carboxylase] ligase
MSESFVSWFANGSPPQRIGRKVLHLEETTSTNTIAAQYAADPSHDGLVVLANAQTAGRGRLGRSWSSPPGQGIWTSVLLFPPEGLRRPSLLTILAASSVCETIEDLTRVSPAIKWPNDVYIQNRKVCGILVEQNIPAGGAPPAAIVGIGLNLTVPAETFAAAGLHQAGSLAMFVENMPSRRTVFQALLHRLDRGYQELLSGQVAELEERWRQRCGLIGRWVRLTSLGQVWEGQLLEISFDALVIRDEQGEHQCFRPEAVSELLALKRR